MLSLLSAAPLHPYGMQRLIRLWGKDQVINVGQRASLYKTIKRLLKEGLIRVRSTERDQQFPERTLYELTDEGRSEALIWLADMLSTRRNEFPEFPAALSFTALLGPEATLTSLERRAEQLRADVAGLERELAKAPVMLPRVLLLESEYLRAAAAAELAWVGAVTRDLREGALRWGPELADMARSFVQE